VQDLQHWCQQLSLADKQLQDIQQKMQRLEATLQEHQQRPEHELLPEPTQAPAQQQGADTTRGHGRGTEELVASLQQHLAALAALKSWEEGAHDVE
jgi:hypothetical protein